MIIPHLFAEYQGGQIRLSDEYSDYKWVKISGLKLFEPKIENLETIISSLLKIQPDFNDDDYQII